jgi:hypothetical protein
MPKKSATTKSPSPSVKAIVSKAAFVRSLPLATPAKDVVAKAKLQGIALTDAYVYNVRATWKARKKSSKRTGSKPGKRKPLTLKVGGRRGAEDLLRAVAAELGLVRAIAVLKAEHARVRKLLGS